MFLFNHLVTRGLKGISTKQGSPWDKGACIN